MGRAGAATLVPTFEPTAAASAARIVAKEAAAAAEKAAAGTVAAVAAVAAAVAPQANVAAPLPINTPTATLYVGDLHPDVDEAQLFKKFSPIGQFLSAQVCRDHVTRRSRGYAYVNYVRPEDAAKAIDQFNGDLMMGRPIRVMFSQRDSSRRHDNKANVFIKNLEKSIDSRSIYDTFAKFGTILSSKVATDEQGNSRGFGFVHYQSEADAKEAIEKVNGMLLGGQKVVVTQFIPRAIRLKNFTNLFVKGFGDTLDQEKLTALFSQFGTITACVVMTDGNGKPKGFGFIAFEMNEQAEAAVNALHGKGVPGAEDKILYVARVQKKYERATLLTREYTQRRAERRYRGVNLYVKNLDETVDDVALRQHFEPFGSIISAEVVLTEQQRSKGFGFVCFEQPEAASRALAETNQTIFRGKTLYVEPFQAKEDRRAQLTQCYMQCIAQLRMQHQQQESYGNGTVQQRVAVPFNQPHLPQFPFMASQPTQRLYQQGFHVTGGPRKGANFRGRDDDDEDDGGATFTTRQYVPPPATYQQPLPPRPVPQPNIGVPTGSGGRQLTTQMLAQAAPVQQKQMLGEQIYAFIQRIFKGTVDAGKITGMMLEMDNADLVMMLQDTTLLCAKILEASAVLLQQGAGLLRAIVEQLSESAKEIGTRPHAETNDGTDSNVQSEICTSSTHPNESVRDNEATVAEVMARVGDLGPSSGSTADLPVSGAKDELIERLLHKDGTLSYEGLEEKTAEKLGELLKKKVEEFREEPLSLAITSPNSTPRPMAVKLLRFEDRKPDWCLSPLTLGVGCGSNRRLLYFSRELLVLHSPEFALKFAEENGFRRFEPGAIVELPDDDPREFDALCALILSDWTPDRCIALRLASNYQMDDVLHDFDNHVSASADVVSQSSYLIRCTDNASLPRTKAALFRDICKRQRLDELRKSGAWNKLSDTLRQELEEHYYNDQKKANGREEFCSIHVPEIQWPNPLTFESPVAEHCGGVTSLCLIVGQGEQKKELHCSRELLFNWLPGLREQLKNGCDSLELEDDSADDFVVAMNYWLRKMPWEVMSAQEKSVYVCLAYKYQCNEDFWSMINSLKSLTPCHRLYLAEKCRIVDLERKYSDEICDSAAKFDEARKSEWWPKLSDKLRQSLAMTSEMPAPHAEFLRALARLACPIEETPDEWHSTFFCDFLCASYRCLCERVEPSALFPWDKQQQQRHDEHALDQLLRAVCHLSQLMRRSLSIMYADRFDDSRAYLSATVYLEESVLPSIRASLPARDAEKATRTLSDVRSQLVNKVAEHARHPECETEYPDEFPPGVPVSHTWWKQEEAVEMGDD